MTEKFLIECYTRNKITNNYEKLSEEEIEVFPEERDLSIIANMHNADRLKVSKIYDFENKRNKVVITYSDNTREIIPFDELSNSSIRKKLEEDCNVIIQRLAPTWE